MRVEVTPFFFFSSRRRHTISYGDWSSDVCSSDLGVESEFFRGDSGQKFGAGFIGGIVKLFAGMVLAEMFGVGGRQKGALMMIEPPGEPRRAGILEIDDGVFVAIKCAVLERLRSLVGHPGIEELGCGIDALFIKTRENRGGGGSVEAFIVETNPDLQFPLLSTPRHGSPRRGKPTTMDVQLTNVKSEPKR